MNRKDKKKLTGIIGIILVIAGVTGTIPSAINSLFAGVVSSGILAIVGIIMAIYGFTD